MIKQVTEMISGNFRQWGLCPPVVHAGYTLVSGIQQGRTDYMPGMKGGTL